MRTFTYVEASYGLTSLDLQIERPIRPGWLIDRFEAGLQVCKLALGRSVGWGASSASRFTLETSMAGCEVIYVAVGPVEGTNHTVLTELVRRFSARTVQVLRGVHPQRTNADGYVLANGVVYQTPLPGAPLQLRFVVPTGTTSVELDAFDQAVRTAAGSARARRQSDFTVGHNLPQGWIKASGSFQGLSADDMFQGLSWFQAGVRTDHLG